MNRLIDALNAMPGLSADVDPYIEGPEWVVHLEPARDDDGRPTVEAWVSLMVLAYGTSSWFRDVRFEVTASPPGWNPVPDIWTLAGTAEPDEVAAKVDRLNLIPYDEWAMDEMSKRLEEE